MTDKEFVLQHMPTARWNMNEDGFWPEIYADHPQWRLSALAPIFKRPAVRIAVGPSRHLWHLAAIAVRETLDTGRMTYAGWNDKRPEVWELGLPWPPEDAE